MNSSNIDERILSMKFDNRKFNERIKDTGELLDDFKDKLEFDGVGEGLDALKDSFGEFSDDTGESLTGMFESVGDTASSVADKIRDVFIYKLGGDLYNWGKSMAKALSVDQITAGLSKYEEATTSSFTIMASTGKNIKEVDDALERLMWFSDETSYSFTDMVNNVGKFTSQKIDLDVAIKAMQGIATAAALAGQGTGEASRAMYNFAQSLAQGSVKLMDWKSIENANMATAEFKETIIETAKEIGTLNDQSKTKKGTLVSAETFSSTLSEAWLTSDVLIKSLEKYGGYADKLYEYINTHDVDTAAQAMREMGDAGDKLGMKAFKAAQEARTFTQAIDATKDAVSSGWMQSFKLIIGNTDEATVLFTDLANALWEVFAGGSEARNELLKGWKEAGGREKLLRGIYDALEGIWNLLSTMKEALISAFPELTVDRLISYTEKIEAFGAKLKETFGILQKFRTLYVDQVEQVLNKNWDYGSDPLSQGMKGDAVKRMQEELQELGYDIGDMGADGIYGPKTQKALELFQRDFKVTASGVYDDATHFAIGRALWGTHDKHTLEEVESEYEELSPILQKLQTIMQGVSSAAHILWRGLETLYTIGTHLVSAFEPLWTVFLDIAESIATDITALDESKETADTFTKIIEIADVAIAGLASGIKIFADIIRAAFFGPEAVSDGSEQLKSFATAVQNLKNAIKNSKIGKWFSSLGDKFSNFVESVKEKGFVQTVKDWFVKTWNDVKTYFTSGQAKADALAAVETVKKTIKDIFHSFVALLTSGGKGSGDNTTAEPSTDGEKSLAQRIKEWLISSWESVKTYFTSGQAKADALAAIEKAKKAIKDLFNSILIFIANRGKNPDEMTDKEFVDANKRLKRLQSIGETIKGFFSGVISSVVNVYNTIVNSKLFQQIGEDLVKVKDRIVSFFTKLFTKDENKQLAKSEENGSRLERVLDKLYSVYMKVRNAILNFVNTVTSSEFWGSIKGKIVSAKEGLVEFVTSLFSKKEEKPVEEAVDDAEKSAQAISDTEGGTQTLFQAIGSFVKSIFTHKKEASEWGPFLIGVGASLAVFFMAFKPLIGTVNKIVALKALQATKKTSFLMFAEGIALLGVGIGLMAASVVALGTTPFAQVATGVGIVVALLGILSGLTAILSRLTIANAGSLKAATGSMLLIAGAIAVLATIATLLGFIPLDILAKGFVRIIAFLGLMFLFIFGLNKLGTVRLKIDGLIQVAAAIAILAGLALILSLFDIRTVLKGLIGVGLIMVALAGFMILVSKLGSSEFKMVGLIGVSAAIAILAGLVLFLGMMPDSVLRKGLIAVGILTLLMAGIIVLAGIFSKTGKIKVSGIVGIAIAITILAENVLLLGLIPVRFLARGLIALGVIGLVLGGLYFMVGRMSSRQLKLKPLLAIVGMISVLLGIVALVSMIPPERLDAVVKILAAVVIAVVAIGGLSALVTKFNVSSGGMVKSAAAITAAFAIVVGVATAFLVGLGSLDKIGGGNFMISRIEKGGEILRKVADALNLAGDPVQTAIWAASLFGAFEVVGVVGTLTGHPFAAVAGATAITGAFIAAAGLATAFVTGLGYIDDAITEAEAGDSDGLVGKVTSGGEVLSAVATALEAVDLNTPLGKISVAATGLGLLFSKSLLLSGKAVLATGAISLAFGVATYIATGIVAGLGEINNWTTDEYSGESGLIDAINKGGEVLAHVGASFGAFVGGFQAAKAAISGVPLEGSKEDKQQSMSAMFDSLVELVGDESEPETKTLDAALASCEKIAEFMNTVGGYEHLQAAPDALNSLLSFTGGEQDAVNAAVGMTSGATAFSIVAEAVATTAKIFSENKDKIESWDWYGPGTGDGGLGTNYAKLEGIVQFMTYLADFMNRLGDPKVYGHLERATKDGGVISSMFGSGDENSNKLTAYETIISAIGQTVDTFYDYFSKDGNIGTLYESSKSKWEAIDWIDTDTTKAGNDLAKLDKIFAFMEPIAGFMNKLGGKKYENLEKASGSFLAAFKDKTAYQTVLDSIGETVKMFGDKNVRDIETGDILSSTDGLARVLSEMPTVLAEIDEKGNVTGVDADKLEGILGVMTQVADFMNYLGGLSIEREPSWFVKFFVGETPFQSVLNATANAIDTFRTIKQKLNKITDDDKLTNDDRGKLDDVVEVMQIVADFMDYLGGLKIEKEPTWFDSFFKGKTSVFGSVLSATQDAVSTASSITSTLKTTEIDDSVVTEFSKVIDMLNLVAGVMERLNQIQTVLVSENNTSYLQGSLQWGDLVAFLDVIKYRIQDFDDIVNDANYSKYVEITTIISDMYGNLAELASVTRSADLDALGDSPISGFSGILDSFDTLSTSLKSDEVVNKVKTGMQKALKPVSEITLSVANSIPYMLVTSDSAGIGLLISRLNSDLTNRASALSSAVKKALQPMTDEVASVGSTITTDVVVQSISTVSQAFAEAGSEQQILLQTTFESLVQWLKDTFYGRFYASGTYFAKGLADGIRNGTYFLTAAARYAANQTKKTIDDSFVVASPSKWGASRGLYLAKGLANGLRDGSKNVSDEALDTAQGAMAAISTALASDIDTTPTIRPVLDLSDISSGASAMNGLFQNPYLDVTTSSRIAKRVAENSGKQTSVSGGNSDVVSAIQSLRDDFDSMIEVMSNLQVVTETGALVAAIGPKMDQYLGRKAMKERRRGI